MAEYIEREAAARMAVEAFMQKCEITKQIIKKECKTMAEYIEREAAARMAVEAATEIFDCHTTLPLLKVANKIRTIPTADVVEVVRCKDCEKWDTSNKLLNTCVCTRWSQSMPYPRLTSPDDFCSYGHRKEGADNAT